MKYEFRVWKDAKKMPTTFEPKEAANRLEEIVSVIGRNGGNNANPDILIDADGANQSPITAADVSYSIGEIEEGDATKEIRVISMHIKGNLYLPLNSNARLEALQTAAGSIMGNKASENKLRDTLLLSKWAEVKPDAADGYYRGVLLSVLTKAGDFRLISANNMYVESYSEDYTEGEFGTFELKLAQKNDPQSKFKVDGLSGEEASIIGQISGALNDTAKKVAKVAAVAGVVGTGLQVAGAVTKKVTETVERFTGGESVATRWIKYAADTSNSAGSLTKTGADLSKTIASKDKNGTEKWDAALKGVQEANDKINERIVTGEDTNNTIIKLSDLEASYLSQIKRDPDRYTEYLNMTDAEKRAELLKARDEMEAAKKLGKAATQAQIDQSNAIVEAINAAAVKKSNGSTVTGGGGDDSK